jgi:cytochrome c biogenesis protein CcdA
MMVATTASVPLAYAFALGLVAAVNPCGFPLLPAYLAVFAGDEAGGGPVERTVRGVVAGASVSVGFVLVFGTLGLIVESGAGLAMGWVPWVMIPLAAAMSVLGIVTALGREVHLPVPSFRRRGSTRVVRMVGFGVAYAIGSLSCALPVFLAGVAGSFTRMGFVAGTATFVAYASGMGVLLTGLSLVVAHAGAPALRKVRAVSRVVPRFAGAVLALVGAYLVLYWVCAVAAPTTTVAPVRVVEGVQSTLAGWLSGSARVFGAVLGAVIVTGLVVAAVASWRTASAGQPGEPNGVPSPHDGPASPGQPVVGAPASSGAAGPVRVGEPVG